MFSPADFSEVDNSHKNGPTVNSSTMKIAAYRSANGNTVCRLGFFTQKPQIDE